ncbi:NADPH-dependent 2,4-dienoyl-CoA reductase, sulfur reductase, partial [Geosmithia morbida]
SYITNAYSPCHTSPSNRSSSRIYRDLRPTQSHDIEEPGTMSSPEIAQVNSRRAHIGIVGAGLAGLRCADILLQKGFEVTVVEGRDRVGGRMHQEKLPNGHWVDMGPNWIHGTEDNPMLDLAKKTGVETGLCDDNTNVFDDTGRLLALEKGEAYSTIMWEIIGDAFKHAEEKSDDIGSEESLYDFFLERVVTKVPETEEDWRRKRQIVMHLSEAWSAYIGTHVTKQSLRFLWLEECIEGENLFCAGTYRKVLEHVAKPALSGADMILGTVADKITYRTDPQDRVKIDTSDGRRLEFDHVVVTSPLGWLKQHLDAFEPALPARLIQAINSIGYGSLEKVTGNIEQVYITFPEAFWHPKNDTEAKVKGFIQWLSPNYAPDTNPYRWNQEAVELANLGPETSHSTILFYTYGDQSAYITSKLSDKDEAEKRRFLADFFEPYYTRLPGYVEGEPRCQPISFLATNWLSDELAGHGSYSNFQVGLTEADEDIETMRYGIPEKGLWLAGEHTAPFVALATATGAYWSGESVGKRIAEMYSATSSEP